MIDRLKYRAPITCSLNITGRCNLRCLHCSARTHHDGANDMTSAQLWQVTDALINRARIFSAQISGGEPLSHPDFFTILEMFGAARIPVTLFTNATLVTPDVAERLVRAPNIQSIETSLDGSCAKTHDALRGPGAFEAAVRGIRTLVAAGLRVHANCIVSRLNLGELPEIARTAGELGIHISFNPVALVGRAREHLDLFALTRKERDDVYDIVKSLSGELPCVNGGVVLEWPRRRAEVCKNIARPTTPGRTAAFCDICKEAIAIRPDGWVVPCNNFWDYPIGNALEQDILEVYHSERAQRIRNLMTLTSDQLDGCRDCLYTSVCSGGCRARGYAATGSLTGIDPSTCIRSCLQEDAHDGTAV